MSSIDRKRVVVVGSSFAGLTAALELRKRVGERHEIVVLDPRADFTFISSLIWLPFGLRQPKDVTFSLAPLYARRGIRFINDAATEIDPAGHTVTTASGEQLAYDRLLIGTGPRLAFEKVPGLGPHGGHTQSVCNLEHALLAREAWGHFLRNPGPVVIGTAQGGSCFGASYEFLLASITGSVRQDSPISRPSRSSARSRSSATSGSGGSATRTRWCGGSSAVWDRGSAQYGHQGGARGRDRARGRPRVARRILDDRAAVHGRRCRTRGCGPRQRDGLRAGRRAVPSPRAPRRVRRRVAVAIAPPAATPVPAGVPKTGQMTETMAKVAARNIAADIDGAERHLLRLDELDAVCILDAGNNGIVFKADHVLAPHATGGAGGNGHRQHVHMMAGPHAHWAKVAFEQMFLQTRKRGVVVL